MRGMRLTLDPSLWPRHTQATIVLASCGGTQHRDLVTLRMGHTMAPVMSTSTARLMS